jgi:hypothetical protein
MMEAGFALCGGGDRAGFALYARKLWRSMSDRLFIFVPTFDDRQKWGQMVYGSVVFCIRNLSLFLSDRSKTQISFIGKYKLKPLTFRFCRATIRTANGIVSEYTQVFLEECFIPKDHLSKPPLCGGFDLFFVCERQPPYLLTKEDFYRCVHTRSIAMAEKRV